MHNPVCSGLRLWRSKPAGLLKFKDGKALFCSKKVGSQGEADGLEVVGLVGVETLVECGLLVCDMVTGGIYWDVPLPVMVSSCLCFAQGSLVSAA